MKKSTKVLLGIATFWPFIYIPLFVLTIFASVLLSEPNGGEPGAFPAIFMVIFPLHFLTIMGSLALTVFYIVNLFRNPRVKKEQQIMWVLLFFFVGMFAEPVYWYLYIWRDEPQAAQQPPRALNNAEAASWQEAARARDERDRDFSTPPPPHGWRG